MASRMGRLWSMVLAAGSGRAVAARRGQTCIIHRHAGGARERGGRGVARWPPRGLAPIARGCGEGRPRILSAVAAGSTAYAGTYGPLWLPGAAGVNLFVFAAVTAWYAMLAYRGQAAEMAEQGNFNAQQIALARRQDDTARTMASLETQRRRDELTPDFGITCDGQFLYVVLAGPQHLPGVQGAIIRIADEMWTDHGTTQIAGGPSAEEVAKIVWGPYEYNTSASGNVTDQRTSRERAYDRTTGKNWDKLPLLPSSRPPWASWTDQQWMNKCRGHPVRLAPASLASRDAATAKLTVSVCSSETNIPQPAAGSACGGPQVVQELGLPR
jgi:hypothetical protein